MRNNIVKEVETQRAEFGNQNSRLTILEAAGTAQGGANIPQIFKKMEDRINNLEKGTSGSGGSGGQKHKGYLPARSMVPQKISSDTAAWRKWKAEILRFLDTENPGMQKFMIELENRKM